MNGRVQAGRTLTNFHATSKHTVACPRCQRQLDVRVYAKGYPGQERDDVWLDCPACGEMGITVVGMPDTGGADIRVTPIWRRFLSGGDGAETYPFLMLLGGLMVGFPAVRWMYHRSWDGAVRMARDLCVMGCVAVV